MRNMRQALSPQRDDILILKFQRVTIRGAQPPRGSPRKFASQRALRGSLTGLCAGLSEGSAGLCGILRGPRDFARVSRVVTLCLWTVGSEEIPRNKKSGKRGKCGHENAQPCPSFPWFLPNNQGKMQKYQGCFCPLRTLKSLEKKGKSSKKAKEIPAKEKSKEIKKPRKRRTGKIGKMRLTGFNVTGFRWPP